jgi:hypothetical protein
MVIIVLCVGLSYLPTGCLHGHLKFFRCVIIILHLLEGQASCSFKLFEPMPRSRQQHSYVHGAFRDAFNVQSENWIHAPLTDLKEMRRRGIG